MDRSVLVAALCTFSCGGAPAHDRAAGEALAITVRAPTSVALACTDVDRQDCNGEFSLTLESRRSDSIFIQRLRIVNGAVSGVGAPVLLNGPSTLVMMVYPHRARALHVPLRITAAVRGAGSELVPGATIAEIEPAPVVVTSPAREAAEAACKACNGEWSVHVTPRAPPEAGLDPGETCNCRTTDAGKACHDSDDCQGWCAATGFTVVETRGADQYGYTSGTCSELVDRYTCGSPIARGASKQPLRLKPRGVEDLGSGCPDYIADEIYRVRLAGDDGLD